MLPKKLKKGEDLSKFTLPELEDRILGDHDGIALIGADHGERCLIMASGKQLVDTLVQAVKRIQEEYGLASDNGPGEPPTPETPEDLEQYDPPDPETLN